MIVAVLNLIGKIYSLKRFFTVNRERVEFDKFDDAKKCTEKFEKSLLSFQDSDIRNSLFDAILCGLLFKLSEYNKVSKENIKDVLGEEFFDKFMKERLIFKSS